MKLAATDSSARNLMSVEDGYFVLSQPSCPGQANREKPMLSIARSRADDLALQIRSRRGGAATTRCLRGSASSSATRQHKRHAHPEKKSTECLLQNLDTFENYISQETSSTQVRIYVKEDLSEYRWSPVSLTSITLSASAAAEI